MQADLTAASRREHLALYDPAAIPADTPVDRDLGAQEPRLLPVPAMMDLASRGQALVVRIPGEDCEALFRLFVDEEPPEELRNKGERLVAGAHLRVPSGLLRADGLEFLCRLGESRMHSEPQEAAVPRGVYGLEVLSLISWKVANRVAEGRRGIGRMAKILGVLVTVYTWLGILMIPANLFVAPLVVSYFWRSGGWRRAATVAAAILVIDAVLLAGFWLLEALRRRSAGLFEVAEADAAFEREHPDIIVVLRTAEEYDSPRVPAFADVRVAR